MTRILTHAYLPSRAFQALLFLVGILFLSSLLLVPRQSMMTIGAEILAVALALWIAVTITDADSLKKAGPRYRHYVKSNLVVNQFVVLPYVVSGVVVLVRGAIGVYGLVPAVLFSFLKAIADAWVLLLEINR